MASHRGSLAGQASAGFRRTLSGVLSASDTAARTWSALAGQPAGSLHALAHTLGQTTAELRHTLDTLHGLGVPVQVHGDLWAVFPPVSPLRPAVNWIEGPQEVHVALDSTQDRALTLLRAGASRCLVLAEQQTAGRGQQGRAWHSPLGAHLYLTLGWRFRRPLVQMAGLSLVVGLGVHHALASLGIHTRLKWPNDVLWGGRKLAGILIELHEDGATGGSLARIGIGLNHAMPITHRPDQPWIDLRAAGLAAPDRHTVLEALLQPLQALLTDFDAHGLAPYRAAYQQHLAGLGTQVHLDAGHTATVQGITDDGALDLSPAAAARSASVQWPAHTFDQPWRLLLDWGNSRLKWAWTPLAGGPVMVGNALDLPAQDGPDALRTLLESLTQALHAAQIHGTPVEMVLASSHGGDRDAHAAALAGHIAAPLRRMASPASHGRWHSAYPQPHRLGIDRALMMWAVLPHLQAGQTALIVSVGTALTLDVLQADGQHRGGLIAPSPTLARAALARLSPHLATEAAPLDAGACRLATDSAAAVVQASRHSALALIQSVAQREQAHSLWLSGGGAPELLAALDGPWPIHHLPDLALQGLALA